MPHLAGLTTSWKISTSAVRHHSSGPSSSLTNHLRPDLTLLWLRFGLGPKRTLLKFGSIAMYIQLSCQNKTLTVNVSCVFVHEMRVVSRCVYMLAYFHVQRWRGWWWRYIWILLTRGHGVSTFVGVTPLDTYRETAGDLQPCLWQKQLVPRLVRVPCVVYHVCARICDSMIDNADTASIF